MYLMNIISKKRFSQQILKITSRGLGAPSFFTLVELWDFSAKIELLEKIKRDCWLQHSEMEYKSETQSFVLIIILPTLSLSWYYIGEKLINLRLRT